MGSFMLPFVTILFGGQNMHRFSNFVFAIPLLLLAGCQNFKPMDFSDAPLANIPSKIKSVFVSDEVKILSEQRQTKKPLVKILDGESPEISMEDGFAAAVVSAVNNDPSIIAAEGELLASGLNVDILKTQKDFKFTSSVFGGIEDVSDNTKGVAIVLSAKRMVFDGGKLEAEIAATEAEVRSLEYTLLSRKNEKAAELLILWSNLERYQNLKDQVDSRLKILEPLILKLEEVTKAGIGDVTMVSAAQRTVTTMRATKIEVDEKYDQAKIAFKSAYGRLPGTLRYENKIINSRIPDSADDQLISDSPLIQAEFAAYQAAEAKLASALANDSFVVAFESRLSRPFGGSSYDSDEAVGLVMRKDLYSGKETGYKVKQIEAEINAKISRLKSLQKDGRLSLMSILQKIDTMTNAIDLSQKNAEDTSDEIVYLRQQLIIGGSTLDKVLSAEARLYQAQSKEIDFKAEKQIAEAKMLAGLGLLLEALEL